MKTIINKKNCTSFVCLLAFLWLQRCKDGGEHRPINADGDAPKMVSNPVVKNLPGGATISYDLPEDEEMLYVKAIYEIRPGVQKEAKSTYYNDNLQLEGFGDEGDYEVKLVSVGRNNKESEPILVHVHPLTPPIKTVFKTVQINEDWGGATIYMDNETEANMTVEVLSTDSLGQLSNISTFYTKMKNARLAVRGFKSEERLFAVLLKDRWDNRSDTIFRNLTPLFEETIPKPFKKLDLPTDYTVPNGTTVLEKIWDKSKSETDFVSLPGHGLPQWFTFDLQVTAKLSRLVLFKRLSERFLYNSGAVKRWEIYGSNNPNPDGSFDDSWTLLMECQSIKPSGSPIGTNTDEDYAYAAAGEEFVFPIDAPPMRYLRWKTYENWGNVTHVNITEIDLYGQVIK